MFNILKKIYPIRNYQKNILIILSFLLISFLSVSLLWHTHTLFGAGDMQFHIKRIMELKDSIDHGVFFPHFGFNYFHGSAVMTLYPYINLYPIVFFSCFIKSYINLIYFFFAFNTFIALIISFYSSFSYNKSYSISYVFAIIYSLSTPFTTYYFGNMDIGVSTVLSFMPLVIFGFLDLLKNLRKSWLLLPIGLTLVIYSHVLSTILLLGFLVMWLLINCSVLTKRIWKRILYSSLFTILLTSVVWFPAMNLIIHNMDNIRPLNTPQLKGYPIQFILKATFLDYPNFCLSVFTIIGLFLSCLLYRHLYRYSKQMFWLSILTLLLCSNLFPWKFVTSISIFKLLKVFQFVYRFYIFPLILLSYLCAECLVKLTHVNLISHYSWQFILMILLIAVSYQLWCQVSIITNNVNDKIFNARYVQMNHANVREHHTIMNKQGIKQIAIRERIINYHVKKHYGYTTPEFKLTNSHQFNLFCQSDIKFLASLDYYPMDSVKYLSNVNNNIAFTSNNKYFIHHKKYNEFVIKNNRANQKYVLPLLVYKHENIKMFVNHHIHKYHINKTGLISIYLYKGNNLIYLRNDLFC